MKHDLWDNMDQKRSGVWEEEMYFKWRLPSSFCIQSFHSFYLKIVWTGSCYLVWTNFRDLKRFSSHQTKLFHMLHKSRPPYSCHSMQDTGLESISRGAQTHTPALSPSGCKRVPLLWAYGLLWQFLLQLHFHFYIRKYMMGNSYLCLPNPKAGQYSVTF